MRTRLREILHRSLPIWILITATTLSSAREPGLPRPIPPPPRPSEWVVQAADWDRVEEARVEAEDGTVWHLSVGIREIGFLRGGGRQIPVTFPRMTISQIAGEDTIPKAILVPTDNRHLSFLTPGSPEIDRLPSLRVTDSVDRWPNPCRFSLLDASGELDVDGDRLPEVAIRRFCSCVEPGCNGIELIELDPTAPNRIDPASLVPDLRLQRVTLLELIPGGDLTRPRLRVAPDYIENCRFVSAAGVAGENNCPNCCRISVILAPFGTGSYRATYDRLFHAKLLERATNDLQYVAAGDPQSQIQSYEEAQIARAASFFYLTGSGEATREIVLEGLGPRKHDLRVIELLTRLDRFFLHDR